MIVKAPSLSDFNLSLSAQALPRVIESASSSIIERDGAEYLVETSATVRNDFRINPETSGTNPLQFLRYRIDPNDIASLDTHSRVLSHFGEADGNVAVFVGARGVTKRLDLPFITEGPTTTETFLHYIEDTLAYALTQSAGELFEDDEVGPPQSMKLFSVHDHASSSYTYNPECWCYSFDFSGLCVWNSNYGTRKYGTLVSPRHFIYANHYTYPNGTTLRFVNKAGLVIERTVTGQQRIGTSDIQVGVLNSDMPAGFAIYRVFPPTVMSRFNSVRFDDLPTLATNQQKEVTFRYGRLSMGSGFSTYSPPAPRNAYFKTAISGDSGNPNFAILGDELVLMGCYLGSTYCPNLPYYYDEINAAMTSLGGGYQLTPVDLSPYAVLD